MRRTNIASQGLSNKELHQRYANSVSSPAMRKWRFADEVNALYMQGLSARPQKKASVLWPIGGSSRTWADRATGLGNAE